MAFSQKVYEVVMQIPAGKVATYGQIARVLGKPRAGRAVGRALHKNPDERYIPCHRVVNREGKLASHFAFGGFEGQKEKLEKEGIKVRRGKVDLLQYQISFKEIKM